MRTASYRNGNELRRFARHEAGNAAIEFAFIGPVFLLLIMAIMQIGLVFVASQRLENATAALGRVVRTGQAKDMSLTPATFRDAICVQMEPFLPCENGNLYIDVQTLSDFSTVPRNIPLNERGEFEGAGAFNPGGAGQIVIVRTFYRYPVWIPMIGSSLADLGGGMRLLSSAAVFRNEPF